MGLTRYDLGTHVLSWDSLKTHEVRVWGSRVARGLTRMRAGLTKYGSEAHQVCPWGSPGMLLDSPGMLLGLTRYASGAHQVCLWDSPSMSLGLTRHVSGIHQEC